MNVVIAGASGFLGTHLTEHLRAAGPRGHRSSYVGRPARRRVHWDPYAGTIDHDVIERRTSW